MCISWSTHPPFAVDRMTSNGSGIVQSAAGVLSSRAWRDSIIAINTPQRPHLICVQPHQRINVTLVDFSVEEPTVSVDRFSRQQAATGAAACSDPLAVVSEGNDDDDDDDDENGTVICGGQRRLSSIYLSTSNCVRFLLNATATRTAEFLIYYEGTQILIPTT